MHTFHSSLHYLSRYSSLLFLIEVFVHSGGIRTTQKHTSIDLYKFEHKYPMVEEVRDSVGIFKL